MYLSTDMLVLELYQNVLFSISYFVYMHVLSFSFIK